MGHAKDKQKPNKNSRLELSHATLHAHHRFKSRANQSDDCARHFPMKVFFVRNPGALSMLATSFSLAADGGSIARKKSAAGPNRGARRRL